MVLVSEHFYTDLVWDPKTSFLAPSLSLALPCGPRQLNSLIPFPVLTWKAWATHADLYHTCVILVGRPTELREGVEREGLRKGRFAGEAWAGVCKEEKLTARKLGVCGRDVMVCLRDVVVCWTWQLLPAVSPAGCVGVACFHLRWEDSR